MHRFTLAVLAAMGFATVGCNNAHASGQDPSPATTTTSPDGASSQAGPALDDILDGLDRVGRNLKSLTADVTLTDTDAALGESTSRTGKFWLDSADGSSRVHVLFTERDDNGRRTADKIEYQLDGGKLIDRNYRKKQQVTRVVLRPGEKRNLVKLGEGPFPLPIGQDKDEVKRQFDVKKIPPSKDDPAGTVRIQLAPKEDTSLSRKMKTIDVWVDTATSLPRRIETADPNGDSTHATDLKNLKINEGVTSENFTLEKIDETWTVTDEPYHDPAADTQKKK